MTGVIETTVYTGPEGRIIRQQMLSGDQYRAYDCAGKHRYFGSQASARRWINAHYAKKGQVKK